ncbi:MAG: HAMP domain-containing sensor histidine kinase [bacterium]|nr:HAMP domain-containing sensor histidine kinase [bacterium]
MKLKTRLAISFLTITLFPTLLAILCFWGLSSYQTRAMEKIYDMGGQVELLNVNSVQLWNQMTQNVQRQIRRELTKNPDKFLETEFQNEINSQLQTRYSYMILRKQEQILYCGGATGDKIYEHLPEYKGVTDNLENGIYLGGDTQHLVKQMDFLFSDETEGSLFIVTEVDDLLPEVKSMLSEMFFAAILILCLTGALMTMWVYQSIWRPLGKLKEATKNIRDGNLDFSLDLEENNDDEIGQLCQDFEEMRIRLKESTEEKAQFDRENKELISNISHDLKTPITAIKGYVEGIMDGVASSPEKLDRYIRVIYNKANDMDHLIDELTFYSKIDTNRIPYNYTKLNVAQYFGDCVEDVGLDMESKGIELGYFNYVDENVLIIADPEQLRKVINNIIGNSVKYLDKKKGIINIRILDDGDFIHVGIEDNGKGIPVKDLPYIFDRFYRTDSSRNSSKGGSGIGLSIVKKIIEDHGGRIWATSKEGIGTEIHFVLRKYQEVVHE